MMLMAVMGWMKVFERILPTLLPDGIIIIIFEVKQGLKKIKVLAVAQSIIHRRYFYLFE